MAAKHAPSSAHPNVNVSDLAANKSSYFPPQTQTQAQAQVQHQYDEQYFNEETLSNTLANSHISSPLGDSLVSPPPRRPTKFTEEWDASVRGSSIIDGPIPRPNMQRSASVASHRSTRSNQSNANDAASVISLSRGNTLKKKNSLRRGGSLKRSSSRRSMNAGSVRSLALDSRGDPATDEAHSAFYCPVPTSGNPTEVLSNRFQSWRKILKDLIAYFREIQTHYEHRSKSLLKLANVSNNLSTPPGFLSSGGLDDALQILRSYHKNSILEANKAREIEEDVILALTGLRSDLQQKIKEIKSLSGDFKNSVEKEMDGTRKAVKSLQDTLGQSELDTSLTTGKQDPYLLRLAVDRQVERQIDEENYLHQAYLNLETSGRELESIVVGEIQKSYNAYAGILKRESDAAYTAIDELRIGPVSMPKDQEWHNFVQKDSQFVDPDIPVRSAEFVHYPGKDHYACQEIRAGLLERKSKYLKSYTAGWYVLSPTHLHEFKSADKTQAPVMSLYLPEQKLGSHSTEGGSSNKFILKGRQTGGMHRGHTWVFRAESHDTMMAWYEDIKTLTEKTPEERSTFVRGHARTYSRSSQRSVSSDGMVDEQDDEPFVHGAAAEQIQVTSPGQSSISSRPQPGGRFPSDLQVNAQRGLQAPLSPSSNSSKSGLLGSQTHNQDRDIIAAAEGLPGSGVGDHYDGQQAETNSQYGYGMEHYGGGMADVSSHAARIRLDAKEDGVNPYSGEAIRKSSGVSQDAPVVVAAPSEHRRQDNYGSQDSGVTGTSSRAVPSDQFENYHTTNTSVNTAPATNNSSVIGAGAAGLAIGTTTGTTTSQPSKAELPSNGVTKQSAPSTASAERPGAGLRNDSVNTVSHLHVPGEYPRGVVQNAA